MRLVVAVLSALAVACSSSPSRFPCDTPRIALQAVPRVGDVLPDPGPACVQTMATPSQMWPSYETVVDGVLYTLGIDKEHRVQFVWTDDRKFRTPEGLKVGDPVPAGEMRHEAGWGVYVILPSGWRAFLSIAPSPKARVTGFFLRD